MTAESDETSTYPLCGMIVDPESAAAERTTEEVRPTTSARRNAPRPSTRERDGIASF